VNGSLATAALTGFDAHTKCIYTRHGVHDRFSYTERRFVTLGLLAGIPVSVVHTESDHEIRIISFRKATRREAQAYFDQLTD
jgi:uncharacterized DUF497 family protein